MAIIKHPCSVTFQVDSITIFLTILYQIMNQKKLLTLILTLVLAHTALSQTITQQLLVNQVDKKIIYGWKYKVGNGTEGISLSRDGNRLFIDYNSQLLSFSIPDKKVLWKKREGWGKLIKMQSLNNGTLAAYIKSGLTGNQWVNTELKDDRGEIVWKTRMVPFAIDDTLGLILGYGNDDKKDLKTSQFGARRIVDGTWLWTDQLEHKRPQKMGVYRKLNNGMYLVFHDALSLIDIQHGVVRQIPFVTDAEIQESHLHQVGTTHRSIYNMKSQLLTVGDTLLIADRKRLYCLTSDLDVLWEATLPSDKTSSSFLSQHHGKVYLLNLGTVSELNQRYPCTWGKPYLARFDLATGALEDLTDVDIPTPVLSVQTNGRQFLTYSQNTTLHVIAQHENPTTVKLKGKSIKKIMGLLEEKAYRLNNNKVVSDVEHLYAYRLAGFAYGVLSYEKLIVINQALESEDANWPLLKTDDHIYVQRPSEKNAPTIFLVTDNDENVIMRLEVDKGIRLMRNNGRLAILTDNSIIWADDPTAPIH